MDHNTAHMMAAKELSAVRRKPVAAGHDFARIYNQDALLTSQSAEKGVYTEVNAVDVDDARPSRGLRFSGWRVGACLAAVVTFIVLVLNIAATAFLVDKGPYQLGLPEIYRGQCPHVEKLDTALHLLINVLSTLLLAGSNYCMQCLVAPTRNTLDVMHSCGEWMDVGVSSLRNLSRVSWRSRLVWIILLLTSLPLHLMYNSAIFVSLAVHDYKVRVVSSTQIDRLLSGNVTTTEEWASDLSSWERLDNADCIRAYTANVNSDYVNLVVVHGNVWRDDDVVLTEHTEPWKYALRSPHTSYLPYKWVCTNYSTSTLEVNDCDMQIPSILARADEWEPLGFSSDYCLSQRSQAACGLNANMPIMVTVVVCNLVKLLVMLYIAFGIHEVPLLVVGDAIDSFLRVPDETTRGVCMLSEDQARDAPGPMSTAAGWKWRTKNEVVVDASKVPRRYVAAVSWNWVATFLLWFMSVGTMLVMLIYGISQVDFDADRSLGYLWRLGFGEVNGKTLISGNAWLPDRIPNYSDRILLAVLIANTPQIILSMLYLSVNNLVTSMCLAIEWAQFARIRKTLRVSAPIGGQRSTYFLTIPYRYGVPMLFASGLLHWLVSQSLFVAVVSVYNQNDVLYLPYQVVTCGYSPAAIVFTAILGGIVLIVLCTVGFFRLKTQMPVASSCSAAISAACHPPRSEENVSLKPVMWGVIPGMVDHEGFGHCSFSAEPVEQLTTGRYK